MNNFTLMYLILGTMIVMFTLDELIGTNIEIPILIIFLPITTVLILFSTTVENIEKCITKIKNKLKHTKNKILTKT